MKKRLLSIIAACMLIICLAYPAAAETFTSQNDMSVTFTKDGEMEEQGFSGENDKTSIDDYISEYMEPGDTAVFEIQLKNEYAGETDWWMENRIIYSLEDRSNDHIAKGGGYTYELTYTDPKGEEHTLFDNMNVGGDDESHGTGLWEVTYGLRPENEDEKFENFFFLDTFKDGDQGLITLKVSLDGETQGNDYQDTLADLGMNFAVEMEKPETETTTRQQQTTQQQTTRQQTTTRSSSYTPSSVKTGDESNAFIYFVMLAAAGVIILLFAIVVVKKRRKENDS